MSRLEREIGLPGEQGEAFLRVPRQVMPWMRALKGGGGGRYVAVPYPVGDSTQSDMNTLACAALFRGLHAGPPVMWTRGGANDGCFRSLPADTVAASAYEGS
jgi:hypothetical protein